MKIEDRGILKITVWIDGFNYAVMLVRPEDMASMNANISEFPEYLFCCIVGRVDLVVSEKMKTLKLKPIIKYVPDVPPGNTLIPVKNLIQ